MPIPSGDTPQQSIPQILVITDPEDAYGVQLVRADTKEVVAKGCLVANLIDGAILLAGQELQVNIRFVGVAT